MQCLQIRFAILSSVITDMVSPNNGLISKIFMQILPFGTLYIQISNLIWIKSVRHRSLESPTAEELRSIFTGFR
jgi:hypothetical protein